MSLSARRTGMLSKLWANATLLGISALMLAAVSQARAGETHVEETLDDVLAEQQALASRFPDAEPANRELSAIEKPYFVGLAQVTPGAVIPTAGTADTQPVLATVQAEGEAVAEESGRLHRALRERDFTIAYGRKLPFSRFDGRTDVALFQFIPRWGRFRNDHDEFLWEIPITYATSPRDAYAAGVTLMFRHHFSSNRDFAPFVEIGSGIVFTDFDDKFKELGGSFQFTPQAGIGFRKSIGRMSDLVVGARWFHMSNAGLRSPNTGLNNYLLTVGYSQLF